MKNDGILEVAAAMNLAESKQQTICAEQKEYKTMQKFIVGMDRSVTGALMLLDAAGNDDAGHHISLCCSVRR